MKSLLFVGMGAALAALVSHSASAQDAQTINQNIRQESIQRSINEGIPPNSRIPNQAPSLGLGNIYGLNPCAAGVSVGVTTPLVGLGGAFSTIDDECQTRNNAAVLVSGLRDEAAAREVLCTIPSIRAAFIRVGRPCIADGGGVVIIPSNYPAGAGQAGQFDGSTGAAGARQLPPSAIPSGGGAGGQRSEAPAVIQANVPAFCRTPGLSVGLYPECLGQQVSAAPRASAVRPVVARPRPAQRPVAQERQALPDRPVLGNAAGDPAGCEQMSTAIRRLYAECVAADRQIALAAARGKAAVASRGVATAQR